MSELDRGREAYAQRSWRQAYEALVEADRREGLATEDLERLGIAAYLLALEDDSVAFLDRAYRAHLVDERPLRAVRCAFWAGMQLVMRGELGPGGGWLGRAQRLLEQQEEQTAEHGYLLIPLAFQQEAAGEWESAVETARRADGDRGALQRPRPLGTHGAGARASSWWSTAALPEGMRLLDESLVSAMSDAQSPLVAGHRLLRGHHRVRGDVRGPCAREWTGSALTVVRDQPELVAFTGRCLIHRAEIMQLGGQWE